MAILAVYVMKNDTTHHKSQMLAFLSADEHGVLSLVVSFKMQDAIDAMGTRDRQLRFTFSSSQRSQIFSSALPFPGQKNA